MQPEPLTTRARRSLVATWDLLLLELRVVTGSRSLVLAAVIGTWFVAVSAWALLESEPLPTAAFYGWAVVGPTIWPAMILGMLAVMGDRDSQQLEVTFVSKGGRHHVWAFRATAIVAYCWLAAGALSVATWALLDRDHAPIGAALHGLLPIAFVASLTILASVLFKSGALGGLTTFVAILLSRMILHPLRSRFDVFLNPFDPPPDLIDPKSWIRTVVHNRALLAVLSGAFVAGALALLQRRERLLK